jgi:hypothetical protein
MDDKPEYDLQEDCYDHDGQKNSNYIFHKFIQYRCQSEIKGHATPSFFDKIPTTRTAETARVVLGIIYAISYL